MIFVCCLLVTMTLSSIVAQAEYEKTLEIIIKSIYLHLRLGTEINKTNEAKVFGLALFLKWGECGLTFPGETEQMSIHPR